ncbi:MAG: hypothetical protein QE271_13515 [Bacteriovoracaceae bacterium]|nr:hypothetical protein [Bacteriovoracaceae bacterium]
MKLWNLLLVLCTVSFSTVAFSQVSKYQEMAVDDPSCALSMMDRTIDLNQGEVAKGVVDVHYILDQLRAVHSKYLDNRDPKDPKKYNSSKFSFEEKAKFFRSLTVTLTDSDEKEVILYYQSAFDFDYVLETKNGVTEKVYFSVCPGHNVTLHPVYFSITKNKSEIYSRSF